MPYLEHRGFLHWNHQWLQHLPLPGPPTSLGVLDLRNWLPPSAGKEQRAANAFWILFRLEQTNTTSLQQKGIFLHQVCVPLYWWALMEETAQESPKAIPRKAAGFSWKAHVSPSCLHKNHWRQQCNEHSPNKRNSFPEKTQLRVPQRARGIPTLLFVTRLSHGRAELDNPHSSVSSASSNFTPGHRCLLKSDPTKCWIQHYQWPVFACGLQKDVQTWAWY